MLMEQNWRCEEFDMFLGLKRGARLHLHYKQAQNAGHRPENEVVR
jgi:hypothetical protein